MLKYIAVMFVCVVLSAALLGCAAATEPPVAQEAPVVEVVVPIAPPEVPKEVEADPPEQEVDVVAMNDAENITTEFVPDWVAITQRVDELVEFFTSNLVDGITIEDVIKELGIEPARTWTEENHEGLENPVERTFYDFDLMTSHNYIHFPFLSVMTGDAHHEQLLLGDIGIAVLLRIREGYAHLESVSIYHGDPSMDGSFHNISIFMSGLNVVVSPSHIIPHPSILN